MDQHSFIPDCTAEVLQSTQMQKAKREISKLKSETLSFLLVWIFMEIVSEKKQTQLRWDTAWSKIGCISLCVVIESETSFATENYTWFITKLVGGKKSFTRCFFFSFQYLFQNTRRLKKNRWRTFFLQTCKWHKTGNSLPCLPELRLLLAAVIVCSVKAFF